jgi:hypothetical protein
VSRDSQLKDRWEELIVKLSAKFSDGDPMDIDGVIYLIGIQELGQYHRTYKKEEKVNLMHIAICRVLSSSGFYKLEGLDEDGWPHWKPDKPLPHFDLLEQEKLLKMHVIDYFKEEYGLEPGEERGEQI